MCRLYAHIAAKPESAEDLLAESGKSLLRQSKVRGREQKDGWGIGYFSGHRGQATGLRVIKSPRAIYKEEGRFRRAIAGARAPILIAHIRAASNPRKLLRSRLIGLANSQPFRAGRLLFAHNGTLNIPDAVQARLGALRRNVKGVNDSEVYFWQFIKFFRKRRDVAKALEACCLELRGLWEAGNRIEGKERPHSGLNTLISDGSKLYAFCHYPGTAKAQLSDRPWGRMVWTRRGGRLVVASEPMDKGRWHDFRDGELLTADASGRVRRRRLKLPW